MISNNCNNFSVDGGIPRRKWMVHITSCATCMMRCTVDFSGYASVHRKIIKSFLKDIQINFLYIKQWFFYKKLSFYYQESDFLSLYKKFNFRFKNILYQKLVQNDWQKGYTSINQTGNKSFATSTSNQILDIYNLFFFLR